jgi:hypothetical protein
VWNSFKSVALALTALSATAQNIEPPRPIADPPEAFGVKLRQVDVKPIDATHFVAVMENVGRWQTGTLDIFIFDKSKPDSTLVLDNESEKTLGQLPTLEVIDQHSAYVHFYSDYGFYERSLKYLFELDSYHAPVRIRYGILSLTSVVRLDGKLYYAASYSPPEPHPHTWHAEHLTIAIQPQDGALPIFQVSSLPLANTPAPVLPEQVRVENITPPGQPHRPSTIFVGAKSYTAPIPTLHFYRLTLPEKQPPIEIESDIGPYVERDGKIWFATTFYDGEGTSGIGAIGSFDIASHHYEMEYLPEIIHRSASVMILDGDNLWIGLQQRPEGADIGKGLLRYNIQSGAVQTFPIPDVIYTLNFAGDALYCGTSHGLYMLRADHLTQLRFEPDVTSRLIMVPRPIEK